MAEMDTPQFGNFSIENTIEMGMGNADLLNDLMAPETATSTPDDIQEISNDKPATPDKKSAKPEATSSEEKEEKKEDNTQLIQDFLMGGDEEEEEEEEETPKASEKKKETTPPAEEESEEEEVNQFTALSRDLFKLGVFSKDEDDEDDNETVISTPEEFLERFNAEKKKGAIEIVENFIGQHGEDYQKAFDAIFVKGVDPKDYFGTYNNIQSFAEMDLTSESNQVAVLKQEIGRAHV